MNKTLFIFALISITAFFCSCKNSSHQSMTSSKSTSLFTDDCKSLLTCKLTSREMQQRKATVLAPLRKNVLEKKELNNGYAFKFQGSDAMIDTLTSFIKTERQCCDFFTFNLSITNEKSYLWLELSGPEGTKDFIKSEMEL